jgi:hypothetical protein
MKLDVPHYRQRFDFSCGPACLMIAMKFFDNRMKLNRELELDIWREAHLIEIWGTSRYGLALSAHRRGFPTRIVSNADDMGYAGTIKNSEYKIDKKWLRHFFEDLKRKCSKAKIEEKIIDFDVDEIRKVLDDGAIPIILVSAEFLSDEKIPHWIVVKGYDKKHFYIDNPLDTVKNMKEKIPAETIRRFLGFRGKKSIVAVYPPK